MQTFLPYPDYEESAAVLDRQRLGKQRVENLQIIKAIIDPSYGWQNHPAVNMWRGSLGSLLMYQNAICTEWTDRGYKDTCLEKTKQLIIDAHSLGIVIHFEPPKWLGNTMLHMSHRSNLLRKYPEYYGSLFEEELTDTMEYVWP